MRKNFISLFLIIILSLIFIPSPIEMCDEIEKTLIVQSTGGENYTSIQEAIDNANINDVVFVKSGIYHETVSINKSITLIGEDKNTTIIDTNYSGFYAILIQTSDVNISGFTIQNSTIGIYIASNKNVYNSTTSNNIFINNRGGIYLSNNSTNNCIFRNLITANDGDGIRLYKSHNNEIYENTIEYQNSYGIILWDSSCSNMIFDNLIIGNKNGIGFRRWSDNNFVNNNTIRDNRNSGIILGYSFHNNIANNIMKDNDIGISISDSSYNFISANYIENNHKGIYLYDSVNNTISETNIFVNNGEDISEGSKTFNTPGFELIFIFSAAFLIFLKRRK